MEVNEEELPKPEQPSVNTFHDFIPKPQPPTQMSYFGQLALLIGLVFGGLFLAAILSIIVIFTMMGGHLSALNAAQLMKPEYANANKVLQLVSTISLFFVPAFLFALIAHRKPLKYLGFL